MISSAPSCLNSGFRLPRTRAAAARSLARRSSLTPVPIGVITILLPSKLNETSLPGATPAAMRMCLGIVTCPLSVTCMVSSVGMRSRNPTISTAGPATKRRLRRLTFELSGRRRQDARPGLAKMYRVPPDRAWWPAVGAPLERGVRLPCGDGDKMCTWPC